MSRVLVVPDVHLKPDMIADADEIMIKSGLEQAVFLGDVADDWDQEANIELYNATFFAVKDFMYKHPKSLFCFGNHDISYRWRAFESGYSDFAREAVLSFLLDMGYLEDRCAYIHRVENVIFSHAGLMRSFVEEHFPDESDRDIDHMMSVINEMGREELWKDDSPIWARPQKGEAIPYRMTGMLQVVGHTPVKKPLLLDGVLSLDTFSTYGDGDPIGNRQWVVVDCSDSSFTGVMP